MAPYSGIILAGGASARLGADKAFIEVGGKPLAHRVIDVLGGLCDEIIVSANDPAPYRELPVRVTVDERPGEGALMGLYSALRAMRNERAFAAACDMPFLSGELIRWMMENAGGADVVAPKLNGYLEPLHAVYSARCIEAIRKHLERGHKKITSFYPDVEVKYVPGEIMKKFDRHGTAFFNINTPADLAEARRLAQEVGAK